MKVFIGSSKEAQEELREVAAWIQEAGLIPVPWDAPTLFRPGENTFHELIKLSKKIDAAVFIFSEDDKIWYRNDSTMQPRDNILIEYGLFSGTLGPTKTVLCRKNTPKLATDILGINYIDISFDKKASAQLQLQNWAKNLLQTDKPIKSNLAQLWDNRHELSPSLSTRIKNSKKDIFFVGFSLKSTFDHNRNVLTEILNENPHLKVRMLMVNPNSLHAEAHEAFSDREVRTEIRGVIDQMESFYNDLNKTAKNNIDIRLTHYLPRCAVKVFDYNTVLLNFYLYKSRAQENPVIEISKNKHQEIFNSTIKSIENLFTLKLDNKQTNHLLITNGRWNQLV